MPKSGDLIREEYLKHNNFATYKWHSRLNSKTVNVHVP